MNTAKCIQKVINHNSRGASFGASSVKNFNLHKNVIYEHMLFRNEKYEY